MLYSSVKTFFISLIQFPLLIYKLFYIHYLTFVLPLINKIKYILSEYNRRKKKNIYLKKKNVLINCTFYSF